MSENPAITTTPSMPVSPAASVTPLAPVTPTTPAAGPFRGPLKYSVETPAPQLEAGKKISINLLINNPYDVPVKIISANTVLPSHFEDAEKKPYGFFRSIAEIGKQEALEEFDRSERLQVISSKSLRKAPRTSPAAPDDSARIAGSVSLGNAAGNSSPTQHGGNDADDEMILQPGNTIVRAFTLRTRQTLLFTPSVHNMNAQICYQIGDGKQNFDTVRYQLNIRAQFKSLIVGSLLGSVVGTALRFSAPLPTWDFTTLAPFYIALVTGMLVAAVLVIAFARKKDAQPFITVEDFWGGFFVGFVAGYVGKGLVDGLIPDVR